MSAPERTPDNGLWLFAVVASLVNLRETIRTDSPGVLVCRMIGAAHKLNEELVISSVPVGYRITGDLRAALSHELAIVTMELNRRLGWDE